MNPWDKFVGDRLSEMALEHAFMLVWNLALTVAVIFLVSTRKTEKPKEHDENQAT